MSKAISNAINKKIAELGGGGGTVSSSSYQSDVLNNAKKQIVASLAQKKIGLDTLGNDVNIAITSMKEVLTNWQNADSIGAARQNLNSMLDRLNYAEQYYTNHGADYNAEDVNGLLSYIKSAKEYLSGSLTGALDTASELYGSYASADEYSAAQAEREAYLKRLEAYEGLSASEIMALKKQMGTDYEEYKNSKSLFSDIKLLPYKNGSPTPYFLLKERRVKDNESKYADTYSKYGFTVNTYGTDIQFLDELALQRSAEDLVEAAKVTEDAKASVNRDEVISQIKQSASSLEGNAWKYDLLENEELAAYKYYADKAAEGDSAAKNTASFMAVQLTRLVKSRNEDRNLEALRNFSAEHPWTSAALTVSGLNTAAGLVSNTGNAVEGAAAYLLTGKVNKDAPFYKLGKYVDTFRSGQASALSSVTDDKTAKHFIENGYMLGMSIADNLASMAVSYVIGNYVGGTASAASNISLAIMGTSAAGSQIRYALENGATDEQALTLGVIAGALEIVTEKIPLENLIKLGKEGAKNAVIREIVKQMGTEATEEMVSEIGNIIANTVVMAENSDFARRVAELEAQGDKNAKATAFGELALQVVEAGAGGAISGGLLSSGFIGVNSINNADALRADGKKIDAGSSAQSLINAGLKYGEETEIHKLAKSIKLENGHTSEYYKLGKLRYFLTDGIKSSLVSELRASVSEKVKSKSAQNGLIKMLTGEKLSLLERRALAKSSEAQKILTESPAARDISEEWFPIVKNTLYTVKNGSLAIERDGKTYTVTYSQNGGETVQVAENQSISQVSHIIQTMRDGKIPNFNIGLNGEGAADAFARSVREYEQKYETEIPVLVKGAAQALTYLNDGALRIEFAPSQDNKNGIWERNDDGTRKVTITASSGAVYGVLVHEILHDMAETDAGKMLVFEITEWSKKSGTARRGNGSYYNEVRKKYEKNGVSKDIDEEVAASYLQTLLGNEESFVRFLQTLSAQDSKALLKALGESTKEAERIIKEGTLNKENKFLLRQFARLDRLYNEALAQSATLAPVNKNARVDRVDKKTTDSNKKAAPDNKEAEKSRKKNTKKPVTRTKTEKMHVSEKFSYEDKRSIDDNLLKFYHSVMSMESKNLRSKRQRKLGTISESHAKLINDTIKKETGKTMDVTGYELWIDGSAISHIVERHGENGIADSSMKNADDIARIPWAANNAENANIARNNSGKIDYTDQYKDYDGSPSPKILLEKSITDQTMIITECVPDSNAKKIHIISARIIKGGNGQELNMKPIDSPQLTSKTVRDGITTSNSIPQNADLSTESKKKYSFAGEKANTADKLKLSHAQEMLENGVDSETVRKETGWFKGYDGKWRFEIDDSDMKVFASGKYEQDPEIRRYYELVDKVYFKMTATDNETEELRQLDAKIGNKIFSPGVLGEFIDHPALLEAYPKLYGVKLDFENELDNAIGICSPHLNKIALLKSLKDDPKKLKSVLIHEIQHTVQFIEGFTLGASPEYWDQVRNYTKKKLLGSQDALEYWLNAIGYPQYEKKSMARVAAKEITLSEHLKALERFKKESKYAEQIAMHEERVAEYTKTLDEWNSIGKGDPNEMYIATAGEIESRDVAKRIDLTAEQRKNIRPDIDREKFLHSKIEVYYFAANDNGAESDSVKEQLKKHSEELDKMEAVDDVKYTVTNRGKARADASEIFKSSGYKVDRQGFGIIEIGEKQLSESSNYLNTPAEFAAWMSIPKVLKRGIIISGHNNHKQRGFSSVTIAAPVTINGKRGNIAVVVQQKGKNKYHVHRILMPDGSRFVYENIQQNAEPTGDSIAEYHSRKGLSISSASDNSISQDSDLSTENKKFALEDESVGSLGPSYNSVSQKNKAYIEDFQKRIDAWDGKTEGFSFVMGETPLYLSNLKVKSKKIGKKQVRIDATKVKKIMQDHSEMTTEIIKNLPYLLNDPILVLDSKTVAGRLVLLGEVYAKGKPVMMALEINPRTRNGNSTYVDVIKVASAYARNNTQNMLTTSNIRFINENKSRVDDWLKVNRLQLPLPNSQSDSATDSITDFNAKVNSDSKKTLSHSNLSTGNKKFAFENMVENRADFKEKLYSDRDVELSKARAHLTRDRAFSKSEIERNIRDTAKARLSDLLGYEIKKVSFNQTELDQISRALTVRFNQESTDEYRRELCRRAAEILTDSLVSVQSQELVNEKGVEKIAEAFSAYREMQRYRGRIIVAPDTYDLLVNTYGGQQNADRIFLRWVSKKGSGKTLDTIVSELKGNGIEILLGNTDAETLLYFDRVSRAFGDEAYSAHVKLNEKTLGENERNSMIESLADELYAIYKTGGEPGKLALRFSALKAYSELIKVKQILNHHRETGVLGSPEYNSVIKQAQKLSRGVSKNNIKAENARELAKYFTAFLDKQAPELMLYARSVVNSSGDQSSEDAVTDAAQKYNNAKENDTNGIYAHIPPSLAISLAELASLPTPDKSAALGVEDYNTLSELLSLIRRLDSFYARIHRDGRWVDIEPIATSEAKSVSRRKRALEKNSKNEHASEAGNAIELDTKESSVGKKKALKEYMLNSLSPETVAAIVAGYNEEGELYRLIRDIQNGAAEAQYLDSEYKRSFERFFEAKENKGFLKHYQNDRIEYTFKRLLPTGVIRSYRVTLTIGEAIYLYMLSKRPHAELSLAVGAFDFEAKKDGIKEKRNRMPGIAFSGDYTAEEYEAQIHKMASFFKDQISEMYEKVFSETDRNFIKICEDFFNNVSSDAKRNADLERYGYTNVGDSYYVPIVRSAYARDVNLLGLDYTLDAFSGVRNFSFNKRTVERARAPLTVCDVWSLVQTHSRNLANYVALTDPLESLQRIYNANIVLNPNDGSTTLRAVIENESWQGFTAYLRDYIKDVQGISDISASDKQFQKLLRTIKSKYAVSVLSLNIVSAVKQYSSAIAMLNEVSLNSWFHGFAWVENKDKINKYSHSAAIRNDAVDQYRAASGGEKISNLGEKGMFMLSAGDRLTIHRMWNMCQYEVQKKEGFPIGSEENLKAAGKLLDEKIMKVQDTSAAATKSAHARSKQELIAITTMFRSADIKMYSNLYYSFAKLSALFQMKKNDSSLVSDTDIKSQWKTVKKMATVWLTTQLYLNLFDLLRSYLIRGNRRERPIGEGDMTFGEELTVNMLTSIIGQIPIIGSAIEELLSGYEPSNLYYETISNVGTVISDASELLSGDELTLADFMKRARNTAFVFGQLTGIPVRNVYNIIRGTTVFNSAWRYNFDEFFGLNSSYSADLKAAIAGEDEKLAATIIDIVTSGRTGSELTKNAAEEVTVLYTSGHSNILPSSIGNSVKVTVNGENTTIELTVSQQKQLRSEYGKSSSAVSKMISTAMYRSLTSDERAAAVRSMYSIYLSRAKRKILGADMTKPAALSSLMDESKLLCALSHVKTLKNDGKPNAKSRVRMYLRTLGLTADEQNIVMYSAGYRSDDIKALMKRIINRKTLNSEEKKQIFAALSL